jgi:predicted DNA-binding transcriptional regulator AlpA
VDVLLQGHPDVMALRHLMLVLGIKRCALYRWIEGRGFPAPIWVGPNRRWLKSAVREWLVANAGKRQRDNLTFTRKGSRRAKHA